MADPGQLSESERWGFGTSKCGTTSTSLYQTAGRDHPTFDWAPVWSLCRNLWLSLPNRDRTVVGKDFAIPSSDSKLSVGLWISPDPGVSLVDCPQPVKLLAHGDWAHEDTDCNETVIRQINKESNLKLRSQYSSTSLLAVDLPYPY